MVNQVSVDLLTAVHQARKREKIERHKMADYLVDVLLERAELRAALRRVLLSGATPQGIAARRDAWLLLEKGDQDVVSS